MRKTAGIAAIAGAWLSLWAGGVSAQPAPAPVLLFTFTLENDQRLPLAQNTVTTPNVDLQHYGDGRNIVVATGKGPNFPRLFFGLCKGPCGFTVRDRSNAFDLRGRASIRFTTIVSGFHRVRPLIKLADGTLLIGDQAEGSTADYHQYDISFSDCRWLRLRSDQRCHPGRHLGGPGSEQGGRGRLLRRDSRQRRVAGRRSSRGKTTRPSRRRMDRRIRLRTLGTTGETVTGGTARMDLVERVSALVPLLRQHALAAENERRVPQVTLEALDEAGVFRMTAPKKYGGDEADFATQCRVLAEIAGACPSTSWVSTIYSAMTWTASAFPDDTQEELFAGGIPRIAGVFSPTGTAVRAEGGFIVTGRWPYNTGCHGARWTLVVALVPPDSADAGSPIPHCLLVRSAELTILDDWFASGMAGTGSNTVVANGVFVPARRALPLPDMVEGRYPSRHNSGHPYFNHPLAQVLVVNGGGTPLGIARGALEAFFERLPGRGIMYTTYADKSAAPVTHLQAGEASLKIDSASAHVGMATSMLDGHRRGPMTLLDRVRSRAHVGYATGLAREAVDLLFYASGASSIQTHVPMQRFQRDMQALANHAVMHAPTAVELVRPRAVRARAKYAALLRSAIGAAMSASATANTGQLNAAGSTVLVASSP